MNKPEPKHLRASELPGDDEAPRAPALQQRLSQLAPAPVAGGRKAYLPAIFGEERTRTWNLKEPERIASHSALASQLHYTGHLMTGLLMERDYLRFLSPDGSAALSTIEQALRTEEQNFHLIQSWIREFLFDGLLTGESKG